MLLSLSQLTESALSFTAEVCDKWNDRLTGSKACRACADHLAIEIDKFADHTEVQEFSVRPGAFLGYIRINVLLFFLGLLALYLQQLSLAVVLSSLALLITVLEFFIYKEFVDFLFPKKYGKNVIGTLEPSGEVKQQIIVSAHHDSAHVFNFLQKNPATYARKILFATVAQLFMFLATWVLWGLALGGISSPIAYWIVTGILTLNAFFVGQMWFFYSKQGTPGAGDNMVCTAIAMEIGKYLAQQKELGKGLEHTRVLIASWDAEEAGLRGSRAYVKANRESLTKVKTYNYNLECMYNHEQMAFLTSDLNSFVSLSKDMAADCVAVAQKLGYEISTSPFPFLAGGTDAAELAKVGVEATTLAAMNWDSKEGLVAYHTLRDTIEAVDPVAVERSIAIGLRYIEQKEAGVRE